MTAYRVAAALSIALVLAGCGAPSEAPPAPTSPPEVAPSTEAPPAPASEPVSITIAAAGDILAHPMVTMSAQRHAGDDTTYTGGPDRRYDFGPSFDEVREILSGADLAICHMETPLSLDNTNLSAIGAMVFNSPHELADALAGAGYDSCDFASNHTIDQGLDGVRATEEVIRNAGMGYAGPTAHEERAGAPEFLTVGNATVAHMAYTYTLPNNWGPNTDVPEDAPWLGENLWPLVEVDGILERARQAKADGADFVVVSMHWGVEYDREPTEDQRRIATALLESDAVDLILGTHVHVVQPCEKINGKHVLYGMGNSLSNQSPYTHSSLIPATQDGMTAVVTLTKSAEGTVTTEMAYQPTFVNLDGHIITRVTEESNPESFQRTTDAVNLLGGCDASLL